MSTIVRRLFSVAIFLAVVVAVQSTEADVCVYKPPKVNRVCGVIVDPDGRPIPNVGVSVLKDGTAFKAARTNDAGEFDFHAIQSGKYELDATSAGFQHARYQLTVSKPTDRCKQALEIEMAVGGIRCGGDIRVTNRRLSVSSAETAIAIARRAAVNVYGEKKIAAEEPLRAALENDVWSVAGTLCCPDLKGKRTCEVGRCVGGVVQVRLRHSDGKIISITHTK